MIEVLIAIAIVAILATIAYPGYLEAMRRGWRAEARAALVAQMQQQERHFTVDGRYRDYAGMSGEDGDGGKYRISSRSCDGARGIEDCLRLVATLVPALSDPAVGELWLESTGVRGCSGNQPGRCWQ